MSVENRKNGANLGEVIANIRCGKVRLSDQRWLKGLERIGSQFGDDLLVAEDVMVSIFGGDYKERYPVVFQRLSAGRGNPSPHCSREFLGPRSDDNYYEGRTRRGRGRGSRRTRRI